MRLLKKLFCSSFFYQFFGNVFGFVFSELNFFSTDRASSFEYCVCMSLSVYLKFGSSKNFELNLKLERASRKSSTSLPIEILESEQKCKIR